jgi:hypothetical protein
MTDEEFNEKYPYLREMNEEAKELAKRRPIDPESAAYKWAQSFTDEQWERRYARWNWEAEQDARHATKLDFSCSRCRRTINAYFYAEHPNPLWFFECHCTQRFYHADPEITMESWDKEEPGLKEIK